MAIENINPVAAAAAQAAVTATGGTNVETTATDFASWMQQNLAEVNRQLLEGDVSVQNLVTGQTTNLHEVMITLEKAKMSFELLLAVRNKALEAYQELMRMQL